MICIVPDRGGCRGGVCQILFIHGIGLKFLLIMGFVKWGFEVVELIFEIGGLMPFATVRDVHITKFLLLI